VFGIHEQAQKADKGRSSGCMLLPIKITPCTTMVTKSVYGKQFAAEMAMQVNRLQKARCDQTFHSWVTVHHLVKIARRVKAMGQLAH